MIDVKLTPKAFAKSTRTVPIDLEVHCEYPEGRPGAETAAKTSPIFCLN